MRKLSPLDMMFPVGLMAMVFMGIFSLFLISDSNISAGISRLDMQIGMAISHIRFRLMDEIAPHLEKVFFWIPFYCTVILVLARLERVKFLRICVIIFACLAVLVVLILLFNALAAYNVPDICEQTGTDYSRRVTIGPCFSLSTGAAVASGLALFVCYYLERRYWPVKLLLLLWTLLICYGLLYQAIFLPGALLLSIVAGGIIAAGCSTLFKYLLKNYRLDHDYR
jgi:hypothetical protein